MVQPLDSADSKQTLTAKIERERERDERVNKPTVLTAARQRSLGLDSQITDASAGVPQHVCLC